MIRILVPVLGRPQNVLPLLASIERATTSAYSVLFICSPGDEPQQRACAAAEMIVVPWRPGHADFAKKVNHAFGVTDEEWLFQAADDLEFHPGWDTQALAVAQRQRVGVVGTNDLGNPLVKRGHHSTHTLFSRNYIQQYGGTIDNSGTVFSEVYSHEYCDNEFVQTAMARRQWAFAFRSVVEHKHPHWGKAEMDATYEKATRNTQADRALYQRRMRMVSTRQARLDLRRQQALARRRSR